MIPIRKNSIIKEIRILFSILLLFTACEADDIKQIIESEDKIDTDIHYAAESFDLSILLDVEDPEIRAWANSITLLTARSLPNVDEIIVSPSNLYLNNTGANITVQAFGRFTDPIPVLVTDLTNGETIGTGNVSGNGITGGSLTIPVGPYFEKNGNSRVIMVEYFDVIWTYVAVYIQESISMSFESTMEDYIPKDGGKYIITQLGHYPSALPEMARFRAVTLNDEQISNNAIITPPSKTVEIEIYKNEDEPRLVYLQFYLEDTKEWVTFETAIQLGKEISDIVTITNAQLVSSLRPKAQTARINLTSQDDLTGVMVRAYTEWHLYLNPSPKIYLDSVPVVGNSNNWYTEIEIPAAGPMNGWTPDYYTNIFAAGVVITPGSPGVAQWKFEYYNGAEWIPFLTANQLNYYYLGVENNQFNIPLAGGTWSIKVYGYFEPNTVKFRATNATGSEIYSDEVYAINPGGTTLPTILTLTIPATSNARSIYLSYQIEGDTWKVWDVTNSQTGNWRGSYAITQQ